MIQDSRPPLSFMNVKFDIGRFQHFDSGTEFVEPRHKVVSDYLLYHICGGRGTIMLQGERMEFTEGDFFVFTPGMSFILQTPPDAMYSVDAFHLMAYVMDQIDLFSFYPLPVRTSVREYSELRTLMKQLIGLDKEDEFFLFHALPPLCTLLERLIRIGQQDGDALQKISSGSRMKTILWYIEKHYRENISISTLAQEAGLSANYFSTYFKQKTGMTPILFLNQYKIEKSKTMIEEGMSFAEIADQLGFNDQFHFSKTFKRVTGRSPKFYREQML